MTNRYLNPNLKKSENFNRLASIDVVTLANQIISGDRNALSTGITLVESENATLKKLSRALLTNISEKNLKSKSFKIGISGSPGVGKSSFIEALCGCRPTKSVAVLAVDPTSGQSHGSILGDKTRMERLVNRDNAFIRPSPAGKTLGGVTASTREGIMLCEAAGFDYIMVETVGVGQSETAVSKMVDFFILLILPGSGDEVQGIKRGIVELADTIVITKSDGDRKILANDSQQAYKNALHLYRQKYLGWDIPVLKCSSTEIYNMDKVWETVDNFWAYAQKIIDHNHSTTWIENHRSFQNINAYEDYINQIAIDFFLSNPQKSALIKKHRELLKNPLHSIWKLLEELEK